MDLSGTSFFVGRETFLQTLHTVLWRDRRAVIAGMSGVGKTAVLQEYIQRFSQHYQSIVWFNAATDETFLADLIKALQAYSLPIDINQGIEHLFQTLHNHMSTQQHALLILDNFSYTFTFQDSSEQPPTSCLVVITQAQQTPPEIPCLELAGLDAQDGALLVLRQAGLLSAEATLDQAVEKERIAALELARELHGLPIALNLAGRYLRKIGCSIQDYLFSFRDHPAPLYQPASANGRNTEDFAIACELSLVHLEHAQPTALELLQVCALLLSEAIPSALFQGETALIPQDNEEELDLRKESMQVLLDYGLLTAEQEVPTLSMHPLIQDLVSQIAALDKQQRVEQALRLFRQYLPVLETEVLPTRLRVAGHIRHLAKRSEKWAICCNEAAEVFSWAASLLWEQGMVAMAEPLLRKALIVWERTLGPSHPTVATILGNLATMNSLLKNYAEAEALSHRAIVSKSTALGVNHPDVLLALDHLGHVYAEQGKQKDAQLCYEKALSIGKQVKLRLHPAYSTCMYDLALLYIEQGRFAEAEPMLRKVCLVWEKSLGPQDPSTMVAWFSQAEVAARLKNWTRAEACYLRALPVCEKLLGKEHPTTLGHMERAANVFIQEGKLDEAKLNLQRVLEVREQTLGTEHTDVATCLNSLAQVALAHEQFPEALALLERAQSIYASQPIADNLALAAVLDTQAAIEIARQQYEQAVSTYKRSLDIRVQILGEMHLDLVENITRLAPLYLKQGQLHQAEMLLLQALLIYKNAQKPDDLTLDPVLNGLADIEIRREHLDMARMYLERSRAVREQALGQTDPRTTEVLQKLAEVSNTQV